MNLPIIGQAYQARSKALNNQRCVNLFPVLDNQGGKNVGALYGTPGIANYSTNFSGVVRGMLAASDGFLYIVAGQNFYRVQAGGNATLMGTLSGSSTKPVSMRENLTQVMIIDESYGYIYTPSTTTLAQITDPDFTPGGDVGLINGYFIFNVPNSDTFYITSFNDGSSVSALEFSSANIDSDDIVALTTAYQELWLFGAKTVEVWAYDGNIDFPFARIDGATMEIGCAARKSVAKLDNSLFWLSTDERGNGQVVRSVGYQPKVVSTPAIDYAIAQYSDISDAIAYTYQEEGHAFYVITFPTGNATWVYDVSTDLWHERAWTDGNGVFNRHRGVYHAFFGGKHIVSDHTDAVLYRMDMDLFDDAGDTIKRLRTTPHTSQENKRVLWRAIEIDIETGTETGDDDPQFRLRWSDDNGNNWSNYRLASWGKIGEYAKRVIFRRLGYSRDRIYELSIISDNKVSIINAYATAELTSG